MAVDRLVGVDHAAPRLPQTVITASQGTASTDLAAGNTLAVANAYTDAAVADIDGGGGGGGGTTVEVFVYTDEADTRPDADVVFWIPDPFNLPNPFGALPGDCVLRSTPNVLNSATGLTAVEHYTVTEYDALPATDADTVYLIVADP
jgi:hypothetical protein